MVVVIQEKLTKQYKIEGKGWKLPWSVRTVKPAPQMDDFKYKIVFGKENPEWTEKYLKHQVVAFFCFFVLFLCCFLYFVLNNLLLQYLILIRVFFRLEIRRNMHLNQVLQLNRIILIENLLIYDKIAVYCREIHLLERLQMQKMWFPKSHRYKQQTFFEFW